MRKLFALAFVAAFALSAGSAYACSYGQVASTAAPQLASADSAKTTKTVVPSKLDDKG